MKHFFLSAVFNSKIVSDKRVESVIMVTSGVGFFSARNYVTPKQF